MRITIATAVYYPMINGVAVFSHNLAVGLAKRGHEVMVICPSQTGKNYTRTVDGVKTVYLKSTTMKVYPDQVHTVQPKKKVMGVELPHLLYKHGFKVSVFPARQVRKALDDFRPDVVHVQVSDPIGLSVVSYARRHHIPVVTTEHNQPEVLTEPLHVPGFVRRPVNAMLNAYFVNRQSKSDYVTMPTELAIDNLLGEKDLGVPVKAVSNGVDLTNFRPGKVPSAIYNKYSILPNVPTVLYIGRVDPEKNVEMVIEAFDECLKTVPEAQLVIVGDGVDRARLQTLAKRLGIAKSVKFLGRVVGPELYDLYRVGWLFATASEIETQGIVLIEAAASGLPLVAVNAGAVAEVCRDGVNGELLLPGDVDGMAEAMVKILSSKTLREKYAANSVKVAAEHDFARTLDEFEKIYKEVQNPQFH
ncbi:glycosyltransferase [Candidatus Saccharibacteria bacterium]|nr:glycosyltransferase [Candidatus Saccharibacteria bacterium]